MKPTLDDLAAARAVARKQFFETIADLRGQLTAASASTYIKSLIRSRSRDVATASVKQVSAHRGLVAGALAAGIALLIVNVLVKPVHSPSETDNDQ